MKRYIKSDIYMDDDELEAQMVDYLYDNDRYNDDANVEMLVQDFGVSYQEAEDALAAWRMHRHIHAP